MDVYGYATHNYDMHMNALVLIRPDGYIGIFLWTGIVARS